jgi:hypothetical protein
MISGSTRSPTIMRPVRARLTVDRERGKRGSFSVLGLVFDVSHERPPVVKGGGTHGIGSALWYGSFRGLVGCRFIAEYGGGGGLDAIEDRSH